MVQVHVAAVHQLSHSFVLSVCQPQQMCARISLHQAREKVGHPLGQIPAVERAAVNDRELVGEPKLRAPSPPLCLVELKTNQIDATRNYLVMRRAAAQSVPLQNDGPY